MRGSPAGTFGRAFIALLATTWLSASALPVEADEPVPPATVRLMAVGDTNLAWEVGRRIVRRGPEAPFTRVTEYFAQADLVLANLECSLSTNGAPWPRKAVHFGAPALGAQALALAGVDAVTLANNHAMDYGRNAFVDTLELLDAAGVGHAGGGVDRAAAHAPLIVERNGLRVAILSYVTGFTGPYSFSTRAWEARPGTPIGVAIARPTEIAVDVTAARELADVVVVAIHGDGEFRSRPNARQRRASAAAIAAGAALVIGHGSHVLQGYRATDHTLITYSLGNFVFDRYVGEPNFSAILDVTLSANGVESFGWIPIVIRRGFPRPADAAQTNHIMARLRPI